MARYQISRLGRFSSPDRHSGRLVNPQSLNRYAYALDDPINLVDPLGLDVALGNCILDDGTEDNSIDYGTCIQWGGYWQGDSGGKSSAGGGDDGKSQQDDTDQGRNSGEVDDLLSGERMFISIISQTLVPSTIPGLMAVLHGDIDDPFPAEDGWVLDDPVYVHPLETLKEAGNITTPVANGHLAGLVIGGSVVGGFVGLAAPEAFAATNEFFAPYASQLYEGFDFISSICDACSPLAPDSLWGLWGSVLGQILSNPPAPSPVVPSSPSKGSGH